MLENEEWRDVVGLEETHSVSNLGRIKLKERTITRRGKGSYSGRKLTIKEKILIARLEKNGYYRLSLRILDKRQRFSVHRLVCEAFHGPAPEGKTQVDHINLIRHDNHETNLRWASPKENIQHSINCGTINVVGVNNPAAKLTEAQVLEICELLDNSKLTQKQIAKKYDTVQSVISAIKVGSNWNSVTGRKRT